MSASSYMGDSAAKGWPVSQPIEPRHNDEGSTNMGTTEQVTVRWAGKTVRGDVVRRYKNGRVVVDLPGETMWSMGRNGHHTPIPRVTIEPWQIVGEEPLSDNEGSSTMRETLTDSEVATLANICTAAADRYEQLADLCATAATEPGVTVEYERLAAQFSAQAAHATAQAAFFYGGPTVIVEHESDNDEGSAR